VLRRHQFGTWAGQLGDGRAITLAEVEGRGGEAWEVQLKGAGPTPYSRRADGRAVLRSSLRELVCSEAMFHLGVPTTRALSLVITGQPIQRDLLYDGHPALEPGAVVCRVAPSFLRFGSYEIHAARDDVDTLRKLVRFTLERHYPRYLDGERMDIVGFFDEVVQRTAWMVAEWMRVGFVHGVMNTDNMSILGLTIDYGPYGWLESFELDWTPNITDASGRRYRFGNQPQIAQWNLAQLAKALAPVVDDLDPLRRALDRYASEFLVALSARHAAQARADRAGRVRHRGRRSPDRDGCLAGRGRDRHDAVVPAARACAAGQRGRGAARRATRGVLRARHDHPGAAARARRVARRVRRSSQAWRALARTNAARAWTRSTRCTCHVTTSYRR
jgi:uncharacterized protein YdiU (UPF0061 family)